MIIETGDFSIVAVTAIPLLILIMAGFYKRYKWSLLTKILFIIFVSMAMSGILGMYMGMNKFSTAANIVAIVGMCVSTTILGIILGPIMITNPIKEIQKVMEEIAKSGDMSKRTVATTRDEVGAIAASLNTMLDQIMDPVRELSKVAKTISSGDLSVDLEVEVESRGDVTELVNSFRSMVDGLRKIEILEKESREKEEATRAMTIELVKALVESASIFASNAEELSASSEEVTASTEEMASVIQQITHGAQIVATKIEELQKQNKETNRITAEGAQSSRSVVNKMVEIVDRISRDAEAVKGLEDASHEIVKIVDVIRAISEQTNMLALNAAVEAARAGDAGRGFAVVAEEVGKLAGKSAASTEKIEEVINNMKDRIDTTIKGMSVNRTMIEESGQSIQDAVQSFEEIPILIEQMDTAIESMSSAAQDNAAGAQESAASVEELSASMSNVAQSAQELLRASNELNEIAKGLEAGT